MKLGVLAQHGAGMTWPVLDRLFLVHMPAWRFYAANILSAVIWAPALVFSGDLLARVLEQENFATKVFFIALVVAAVAAAVYWVRRQFLAR